MPQIFEITSLSEPCVEVYHALTEAQLRNRQHIEEGVFIAESPKVIKVALDNGYAPLSFLCERKHIENDAAELIARCEGVPVYTGSRELLAQLTGYTLTRGVLCAMRRKELPSVEDICESAQRIVVIEGVSDTTNIGAIFRSAAALGIDGALLTSTACDPFNRRAVRVSMGTVFQIPWTWLKQPVHSLQKHGFKTVAMALCENAMSLDEPSLKNEPRLAIVVGTEGDGLAKETISQADYVVRIPMSHQVDSLNVAAAAAVAFWELKK